MQQPTPSPWSDLQRQSGRLAWRYALAGVVWLAVTDTVGGWLPPGRWRDLYFATKGVVFVALSALFIHGLQHRAIRRFIESRSEIERLEQGYAELIDDLPIPCFVVEPDRGLILHANRAAREVYGVGSSPRLARCLRDLDAAAGGPLCASDLSSRRCSEQLVKHRRADGSEFDVRLLSTHLSRADDEVDVVMCLDVTAQLREQELQRLQAGIDPLTGLLTRNALRERVARAIREGPGRQQMAVLFINIDHFKLINDTQGHPSGDLHLREVATRIGAFAHEDVMVGRFGGDEFVAVMTRPQTPMAPIVLARNIRSAVAGTAGDEDFAVARTCSIGIAWWPEHGADVDTLLSAGDAALCHAKQAGRDRVVEFDPSMRREAWRYVELVQGLRQALALDRLHVRYQPQFCLASGRIVGLEALCAWREASGVEIKASEFIPVAERSGQIVELGQWVLRETLAQVCRWLADGVYDGPVAINVSPVQLRQAGFVDFVQSTIIATGLRTQLVELEITETVALHLDEELRTHLIRLAGMGIAIAIDDFGRGYSSLSHFKRLPITRVKIDASFVRNVDRLSDSQAIVNSMLQMARALGISTVAEGVERKEEALWLRAHGCDAVQGYLYARPAAADALDLSQRYLLEDAGTPLSFNS